MSKYKQKLLDGIDSAREKQTTSLATALDGSKTTRQRMAAFRKIGGISDPASAETALSIVSDPKANDGLRAAVLEKISAFFGKDESFLQRVTRIVSDQGAPDKLRLAALRCLQMNSFSSPMFLARRPAYIAALRSLIEDGNDKIRETAIEHLALNRDEYVQRRLIEGLENPKKKITKPELAVQYLAYDLHADHFPLLRKLASKPPNKKTRMEALRNLGADTESVDLLKSTFADKAEDAELRHLCGVALQRLDPGEFDKAADKIMRARTEHSELKAAILNTKMHLPGSDAKTIKSDIQKLAKKAGEGAEKARTDRLSSLMSMRRM